MRKGGGGTTPGGGGGLRATCADGREGLIQLVLGVWVWGEGGEGGVVESGVDVGAKDGPGDKTGIIVKLLAVAVEQKGGGDGADGEWSTQRGDDLVVGKPDGEGGVEGGGFCGDLGGGS